MTLFRSFLTLSVLLATALSISREVVCNRRLPGTGNVVRFRLTLLRRNPDCLFDHEVWRIEKLPQGKRRLADVLGASNGQGSSWLSVEGKPFALRLSCPSCGHTKSLVRLQSSLRSSDRNCALCCEAMAASGWDLAEKLTENLQPKVRSRSLRSVGIRHGDIVTVGSSAGVRHFEITVTGGDDAFSSRE